MTEVTGSWFAAVGNELFVSAAAGACPSEVEGVVPLFKQFGLVSEMAKGSFWWSILLGPLWLSWTYEFVLKVFELF